MKKQRRTLKYICILLIISTVLLISQKVYAQEINADAKFNDYTEEYKEWLQLSDEEKSKTVVPKMYDSQEQTDNQSYVSSFTNVLKQSQLLTATLSSKYSLRDYISNNVQIRDQKTTNTCWAFATIGSLESNLGLQDYKNSRTARTYDFSERHMDYSSAYAAFLDSKTNNYGYNRTLSAGGNFFYALSYLTNGMGVVDESEMPFEDNQNNIDISGIQNKIVSATVLDTKEFGKATTDEQKESLKSEMKEYISNYGGIYAGVYADTDYTSSSSANINIITGAMYSTGKTMNHAICIIGWDDNYSKDNFNTKCQPTNNGAWIIKNSWGSAVTSTVNSVKAMYYLQNTSSCNSQGWYSAQDIPDSVIISMLEQTYGTGRVTIKDGVIYAEIGDNGYMYVSYEDTTIYSSLYGIDKSEYGKNYYKLYENDILGETQTASILAKQLYLANVFSRSTSVPEKLYRVSVYAPQTYTCKVYVNPNNNNKSLSSMQQVDLTSGSTVTIEPGFHTLELATPVTLTGTSFVVALDVIASDQTNGSAISIGLERPVSGIADDVIVNAGESFLSINDDATSDSGWYDMKTTQMSNEDINSNLLIKAFTSSTSNVKTVEKIAIIAYPTQRTYTENTDSLNMAGGIIKVTYSDGTTENVDMTSSEVAPIGFDNTKLGTENITVYYGGKSSSYTVDIVSSGSGDTNTITTNTTANTTANTTTNTTTNTTGGDNKDTSTPISSDFKKAIANIEESNSYFYTAKTSDNYTKMKIVISNIKIGDSKDLYTYYYHISGKQGETNLSKDDWAAVDSTSVVKNLDGTLSINLEINSKDLKNYAELVDADNLYLYLKEVASNNGTAVESINTMQINNTSETTYYVNDIKAGSLADVTSGKDFTTASNKIPQTGNVPIIVVIILGMFIIGMGTYFAYYKNKNIIRGR